MYGLRYIYLRECKHWIPVQQMDEWMIAEDKISKDVECPSCPQCGTPVRLCFRYGDVIKSFYEDLISIKLECAKDEPKLLASDSDLGLMKNVILSTNWDCGEQLMKALLDKAIDHSSQLKRDERWELASRLHLAYRYGCLVNDLNRSSSSTELLVRAKAVLAILKKKTNMGQKFYATLLKEWNRLEFLRKLQIAQQFEIKPKSLVKVSELLERRLTEDEEDFVASILSQCEAQTDGMMSSSAKKEIRFVHQLSFGETNWTKCLRPNCEAVFPLTRFKLCPECGGE